MEKSQRIGFFCVMRSILTTGRNIPLFFPYRQTGLYISGVIESKSWNWIMRNILRERERFFEYCESDDQGGEDGDGLHQQIDGKHDVAGYPCADYKYSLQCN